MSEQFSTLLNQAVALSASERRVLVMLLLEDLEGAEAATISNAWRHEARRRQIALRSGAVSAIPWADAKARLSTL